MCRVITRNAQEGFQRQLMWRSGEAADLAIEDYGNDGQRELLMNAYFEKVAEDNKYEIQDVVDKKNAGIYGRSYTKLNILGGIRSMTPSTSSPAATPFLGASTLPGA